ncbi:MAG: PorP/SprF family type IX secretion system membrane protein, partial [Chitinophagales bacterium]|nr:PorP/SprF family type IX secretion system membrane protein [Chitinophagales bacterium]
MKNISIILFVILLSSSAWAQDAHFSQFFAAPLYYNPANTGNFSGAWRAGLNYRDQWGSISVPYKTYDLYSDVAIQPKGAVNRFGLGVLALNDVAGDGVLTTSRLQGSAAYQIGFDENSDWRFALGLSGAYVQKTLDIHKLIFDSQWEVDEFNSNLLNNENTITDKINYLDFTAGALLTYLPFDGEKYFLGLSVAHLNEPEESFYNDGNTIHRKYMVTTGGMFPVSNAASLSPQLFYTQQSQAYEFIL